MEALVWLAVPFVVTAVVAVVLHRRAALAGADRSHEARARRVQRALAAQSRR